MKASIRPISTREPVSRPNVRLWKGWMVPPDPPNRHDGKPRWRYWNGSTRSKAARQLSRGALAGCQQRQASGEVPPHNWILTIYLQIRLPHIAADKFNLFGNLWTNHREELLECLYRSFLAHPQQARDVIDLIDQREVFVPLRVGDLVHAHRKYRPDLPVLQTPVDDVFDRLANLFPRCLK